MNFMEQLKARQNGGASMDGTGAVDPAAGAAGDNLFIAPGTATPPAAVIDTPVEPVPESPIVVIEPDDQPLDPDAATDIEADAVASESLLAATAAAESFGWSPALVAMVQSQGLLENTALATMSLESFAGGKVFSVEEAAAVDGEVHAGLVARLKSWSSNALSRMGAMWNHVSGKLSKSEETIAAAESAGVSDEPRRGGVPYKLIAGIAAGVLAAGGVIFLCMRHLSFSALTAAGGIDRAAAAIDRGLTALRGKLPDRFGITKLSLKRKPGAFLPTFEKEVDAKKLSDLYNHQFMSDGSIAAGSHGSIQPKQIGWTTAGLSTIRHAIAETKSTISSAFGGLANIVKDPKSVAEGIITDPHLKTKAVAGGLLAFVSMIVGVAGWLLYHVVLKGANVVASACRAISGGSKSPDGTAAA